MITLSVQEFKVGYVYKSHYQKSDSVTGDLIYKDHDSYLIYEIEERIFAVSLDDRIACDFNLKGEEIHFSKFPICLIPESGKKWEPEV